MLNAKKKKFIAAILGGANQTEAAIIAGYSENRAGITGCELMKDPEIKGALTKKWLRQNDGVVSKAANKVVEADNSAGNFGENSENSSENGEYSRNSLFKTYENPLDFLIAIMNSTGEDIEVRKDAAKAALPYMNAKKGEGGKKELKSDAAKKAAARFVTPQPPRLVANNGK